MKRFEVLISPATVFGMVAAGICLVCYLATKSKQQQPLLRLAPPIPIADGTHQASIATGRGDTGITSLFDGTIASKSEATFEVIGTIDELSAAIGSVHAALDDENQQDSETLKTLQRQLTTVMGVLATPSQTEFRLKQISEIKEMTEHNNTLMNSFDSQLPPLRMFILPSGNELSVRTHLARAVCRRAERAAVRISADAAVIQYLNRLSDLFFTLARWYANGDDCVPRRV
jgi:cob(I)alamin adenosyltransferase